MTTDTKILESKSERVRVRATKREWQQILIQVCYYILLYLCSIPLDEPVMCSCGVELEIPTDVVIKFTATSIFISQSGNVTNNNIQMILRQLIFFQHSPSRPESSYMAEVSVNGSDGFLTSEIATTTVMVEFQNFLPTVYVDGQVRIIFMNSN